MTVGQHEGRGDFYQLYNTCLKFPHWCRCSLLIYLSSFNVTYFSLKGVSWCDFNIQELPAAEIWKQKSAAIKCRLLTAPLPAVILLRVMSGLGVRRARAAGRCYLLEANRTLTSWMCLCCFFSAVTPRDQWPASSLSLFICFLRVNISCFRWKKIIVCGRKFCENRRKQRSP